MCNINHHKFSCRICAKNVHDKDKLFSVTSANFGFIQNVTILIIEITDIFKSVMNPGIAWNVVAQLFLATPYQAKKTFWLVVLVLTVT